MVAHSPRAVEHLDSRLRGNDIGSGLLRLYAPRNDKEADAPSAHGFFGRYALSRMTRGYTDCFKSWALVYVDG